MRTEADLMDAIDTLAGPRPDTTALFERLIADPVAHGGPKSVPVLKPLVAALAVAAVAIAGAFVLGGSGADRHQQTGGTHAPPLQWRFSVGHVAGYTITRDYISRPSAPATDVSETATVTGAGRDKTGGTISFDSDPARLAETGDAVTIHGIRYYFRAGRHVTRQGGLTPAQYADPWKAAGQDAHGPQLTRVYPDGSQVIVSGTFGFEPKTYTYDNAAARRTLAKIALAVRAGGTDPVTMPFHVRSVPDHLVPVSLRNVPVERRNPPGQLGGALPLSACLNYATAGRPSPQDPTESVLTVCRVEQSGSRSATLDAIAFGHDFIADHVVRALADGSLLVVGVGIGHTDTVSHSDLQSIAKHTDVGPRLTTPSTWLDVN